MAIKFAANGKRDLHGLEEEYDKAFDKLQNGVKWSFPKNQEIVISYLKDCKKGIAKSGNVNRRVGKSTLYRNLGILKLLSEKWVKKDFDSMTQKDWDMFYDNMEEDKFLNEYRNKYKPSTKGRIYKIIRKFLKWRYGNNTAYPPYCSNWVTAEEKTTKEFLTRSEVEKLVAAASKIKLKAMLMMLFDGGFRIEELSNLRWTDVRKEEGKEYYRAHVRAETSKTKKERIVSMWLATDYIDNYLNSEKLRLGKEFREDDFMFKTSYSKLYVYINRIGKKVLGKDISPHTMRHSSATYYADVIKTYQQFCARYGWNLKSTSPQIYFHRVEDDTIAAASKEHEIARFKNEFERVKVDNRHMSENMEKMKRQYDEEKSSTQTHIFQLTKALEDMQKRLEKMAKAKERYGD